MKVKVIDRHNEECANCGTKVKEVITLPGTYYEMGMGETQNWDIKKHNYCPNCGEKCERG